MFGRTGELGYSLEVNFYRLLSVANHHTAPATGPPARLVQEERPAGRSRSTPLDETLLHCFSLDDVHERCTLGAARAQNGLLEQID